jgi:hypothetical protein
MHIRFDLALCTSSYSLFWHVAAPRPRYKVQPPVHDLASAIGYLRRERTVTFAAARRMGWFLAHVEGATELSPGDVLAIALGHLRPRLFGAKPRRLANDRCWRGYRPEGKR